MWHIAANVVAPLAGADDVRTNMPDVVVDPIERPPKLLVPAVCAGLLDQRVDELARQVIGAARSAIRLSSIFEDRLRDVASPKIPTLEIDPLLVPLVERLGTRGSRCLVPHASYVAVTYDMEGESGFEPLASRVQSSVFCQIELLP